MEKACTKCGEVKSLEDFYFAPHHKDGRRSACRACSNKSSRAWATANADRAREYRAQWTIDNLDKVRAQAHNWHKNNPGRTRERVTRRRALKLSLGSIHYTGEDVKLLFEAQEGLCAYCGATLEANYHVDHIVPLSRGGGNGPDNICLACSFCNLSKHDWLLGYEWCVCGAARENRRMKT